MSPLYWIEDEVELFKWVQKKLQQFGFSIEIIASRSDALNSTERIRKNPGPIILDLWLPEGGTDPVSASASSPEFGMQLLAELQESLGHEFPVVILSGNLSVDIIDHLQSRHKIPQERIFPKPLLENDRFLACLTSFSKSPVP